MDRLEIFNASLRLLYCFGLQSVITASFQITHRIDESSPLYHCKSRSDFEACKLSVSVSAFDDVQYKQVGEYIHTYPIQCAIGFISALCRPIPLYSQIFSIRIYLSDSIVFNALFEDMVKYDVKSGFLKVVQLPACAVLLFPFSLTRTHTYANIK